MVPFRSDIQHFRIQQFRVATDILHLGFDNLYVAVGTWHSLNSKDTYANHVRPHASTGMRPRMPNLEFMRAAQFLTYCIFPLTKLP